VVIPEPDGVGFNDFHEGEDIQLPSGDTVALFCSTESGQQPEPKKA